MALTGEAAIADALFWRLSQLTLSPPIPASYPGLPFTPPAGPYLETSFQPNRPPARPIGFVEPRGALGIFQILVHWPSGQGVIKPYDTAEAIKAHFLVSRETGIIRNGVQIRIVEEPRVAAHLTTDDTRIVVPVTIPWTVWTL